MADDWREKELAAEHHADLILAAPGPRFEAEAANLIGQMTAASYERQLRAARVALKIAYALGREDALTTPS